MKKCLFVMLVLMIGLAPVLASAQGSGGATAPSKSSNPSTPAPSTSAPSASPSLGTGNTSTPSASPSTNGDFSQYKTQADCEKHGGTWQTGSCSKAAK